MIAHTAVQGDCLSSIAHRYGFAWELLWDLPENAALKARRRNPNVIFPGDVVEIPAREEGGVVRPVDAAHRFRIHDGKTYVRVRFLFLGEPRANIPCTLVIDDLRSVERVTDGDGRVSCPIAADASECRIVLHADDADEIYRVDLGALDPVDTLSGVQQRLTNLGFPCGPVDGASGPLMHDGVRRFQASVKIIVDGVAGAVTQNRLLRAHGS